MVDETLFENDDIALSKSLNRSSVLFPNNAGSVGSFSPFCPKHILSESIKVRGEFREIFSCEYISVFLYEYSNISSFKVFKTILSAFKNWDLNEEFFGKVVFVILFEFEEKVFIGIFWVDDSISKLSFSKFSNLSSFWLIIVMGEFSSPSFQKLFSFVWVELNLILLLYRPFCITSPENPWIIGIAFCSNGISWFMYCELLFVLFHIFIIPM